MFRYVTFSIIILLFSLSPKAGDLRIGFVENAPPISDIGHKNPLKPTGLAVNIWTQIAKMKGWSYAYVPPFKTVSDGYDALKSKKIDVLLGPLIPQSLPNITFSHPIYATHLGIATLPPSNNILGHIISAIANQMYLLTFIIVMLGVVIPFFVARNEKKSNPYYHKYRAEKVFFMTMWSFFSVGASIDLIYPLRTRASEILCAVWIGITMIYMSILSASIGSALVVNSLENAFFKPGDFHKKRIAVIEPFHIDQKLEDLPLTQNITTTHTYMKKMGAKIASAPKSMIEALNALKNKEINAIVAPYWALQEDLKNAREEKDIILSPLYFALHILGMATHADAPLIHEINATLSTLKLNGEMGRLCQKYFQGIGRQQCLI